MLTCIVHDFHSLALQQDTIICFIVKLYFLPTVIVKNVFMLYIDDVKCKYRVISLRCRIMLSFYSEMPNATDFKLIVSYRVQVDVFFIKISSKSVKQFRFYMYLRKNFLFATSVFSLENGGTVFFPIFSFCNILSQNHEISPK